MSAIEGQGDEVAPRRKASAKFKQTDITKACKGVLAAGLVPKRAEIDRDGRMVLIFDGADAAEPATALDQWRAKRDAQAR